MTDSSPLDALLELMARLRDPQTGCPWDREQTYATIVPHTIEEAYEVADAIAREDWAELRDELGDLLFQVVFYAQIAREEGRFEFADVARGIVEKMTRRHPHVFADARYADAAEQTAAWEQLKAAEKAEQPAGVLAGVPLALPALTRAVKLQKKASKVGFDWGALGPILAKIQEEIGEIRHEITSHAPAERLADELGDVLFAVANLARHLQIDPEAALRGTNRKFERRFRWIEHWLAETGRTPTESTLAEMDALWERAKLDEK
ncbi:MAG: nucleoside triphosphate pyrophosphohydrolase [Candidatus Competibacteraceae bacterium]|nr:nucleoside triphosphate pyrophosphohydrolase [Candidatus Competibacteraceae bacterium]MBK7984592.1 nucleoside triphosphate pyrophosphohydrolase [Candidatus Competibacteraceae bacterium]MBK8897155.1 nucleoside triphosphate pyrophosphohydrolase [Candidatus Competibacteraceae bacterium]MBK8964638.1 nucleoside triphosphate pyrophosphohydrolase [Candidatus Competibacteraceae bacterium]MBK9952636.1 nucleoside triphosphate pyrophosphohydrolase [Candidatus Competibacteraceae bacterium]